VYSREKLLVQQQQQQQGVCHTVALPFTLKKNLSILRQKKNYEKKKNSKIFHHAKKNYNLQKKIH
jgi:uncharacterized protein YigA (DUF484 family)